MNTATSQSQDSLSTDEMEVRALYQDLLEGWSQRNADAFATLFAEDGEVLGFDGSQMSGRVEITSTLQQIFGDHVTAPYVSKVRSVRLLSPAVGMLRHRRDGATRTVGPQSGSRCSSDTYHHQARWRTSQAKWLWNVLCCIHSMCREAELRSQ